MGAKKRRDWFDRQQVTIGEPVPLGCGRPWHRDVWRVSGLDAHGMPVHDYIDVAQPPCCKRIMELE